MADVNIFEKYGIKQVANVYFEALSTDEKAGVYKGDIVLYLDTLKVSTIETTAENVAAQGGWGNPRLIQWDYGKEINITLTDALISLESLKFMLGGNLKKAGNNGAKVQVHRTAEAEVSGGVVSAPIDSFTKNNAYPYAWEGHPIRVLNLTQGWRTQVLGYDGSTPATYSASEAESKWSSSNSVTFLNTALGLANGTNTIHEGDKLRFFWEEEHTENNSAVEITISSDTFPGTYRVVGDTFIRDTNGKDVPFQFIIEKAKVQSNVTITLEAEGDPSTFDMTLNVLRASSGTDMMRLVRYGDVEAEAAAGDDYGSIQAGQAATGDFTTVATSDLSETSYTNGDYYLLWAGEYIKANAFDDGEFDSTGHTTYYYKNS